MHSHPEYLHGNIDFKTFSSRADGSTKNHIKTVTVRDFDALASNMPAWDRLAHSAPQKVPTLLPGWVDAFLRHRLKPNESWFCSFAYAGAELVGALPLVVTPHPILGSRWPLLRTPFDQYQTTICGDILLSEDQPDAALRSLLAEVKRLVPGHLRLDLQAVRHTSPFWTALGSATDYVVYRGQPLMYSFLDVRGDFDTYLSSFGNMGRNLRRFRKKLEKLGNVSIEILKGSAASADLLPDFLALEASGWKGRNGTAILNNSDQTQFFTTLTGNLAKSGCLEWHTIRVGERLIAAQLAVRSNAAICLLKSAINEDFADCRPGTLLAEATFREGFSRPEIDEINSMSDFDAHGIWHVPCDEYVDVHLVRRKALPLLLQLPRSVYRDHVRPHIPTVIKETYRRLRRQNDPGLDQKPRRAAEAVQLRQK